MAGPSDIDFLAIPAATEDEADGFVRAYRALTAFARLKRQELAMHHERMETNGVADIEVAASLKLLLNEAIAAEALALKADTMLDRAVFVPARPEGSVQ